MLVERTQKAQGVVLNGLSSPPRPFVPPRTPMGREIDWWGGHHTLVRFSWLEYFF